MRQGVLENIFGTDAQQHFPPLLGAAMSRKRTGSAPPSAAKGPRRCRAPAAKERDAIDQPEATELARAFGVDTNAVKGVRMKDQLFSLVDVTMLVTGKDCNYAAQQIRFLRERYLEVNEKIINLKFFAVTSGGTLPVCTAFLILTGTTPFQSGRTHMSTQFFCPFNLPI